ncbi:Pre-mRNA splicing factor-domain-containing protein [Absidia repens]|uniref:Pre-mRNA splicing factor-domain-containing protein n=1 Tax=Absidia repens TaxID=90262 RepID=A0A1X2J0H6_9FUNG|nr:Pre-mRNA splicing factor-domain-containing protein [Absidia repens]
MGGGDLNLKKSWHPSTFKNQERLWKQEKKHAEEQTKIEQMKKELQEERQLLELQRLQEDAGSRKRSDRLDWMYAAPSSNGPKAGGSEMEDFLLGKKNVDDLLKNKAANETTTTDATERFALTNSNANTERDIQAKIREDPLFAIKQKQQSALKSIVDNPLLMKKLKKDKKDKKSKKKDIKDNHDRHHRHSRHHHHRRSPSPLDTERRRKPSSISSSSHSDRRKRSSRDLSDDRKSRR